MQILNKQGIPFYGNVAVGNEIRAVCFFFEGEPTADLLDAPLITEIVVDAHPLGYIHRTESQRGLKPVSGSKWVPQYGAMLHFPKKVVPRTYDAVDVGQDILKQRIARLDYAGHMTVDQAQRVASRSTSLVTFEGTPTLDGVISISNNNLAEITVTVGSSTGVIQAGNYTAPLDTPVVTDGSPVTVGDTGTLRLGTACTAAMVKGTEILKTVTVTNCVMLIWDRSGTNNVVEPYRMEFPVGKTGDNTFIELRATTLSTGEVAHVTNVRAGL